MRPEAAVEMTVVESPKAGLPTTLEIAARFPHFHRPITAIYFLKTYSERSLPHRLHLHPFRLILRLEKTAKQEVSPVAVHSFH
jgi:hypothetical protein